MISVSLDPLHEDASSFWCFRAVHSKDTWRLTESDVGAASRRLDGLFRAAPDLGPGLLYGTLFMEVTQSHVRTQSNPR